MSDPMQLGEQLIIGVDFDNTIVSYDRLFHQVALERGWIPDDLPECKTEVRDFLRKEGRENDWTELQGYVYGLRLPEAPAFPGVMEFFDQAISLGCPVHIVSHKTRYPVRGPEYDLHQAARDWIASHGFFERFGPSFSANNVFFGVSRDDKINRITALNCGVFIDDLEETFLEPRFPYHVEKILFAPERQPRFVPGVRALRRWDQIREYVFGLY